MSIRLVLPVLIILTIVSNFNISDSKFIISIFISIGLIFSDILILESKLMYNSELSIK